MATQTDVANFTNTYAPFATQAGNALGVSPSSVLAQWAFESNFGTTQQAINGFNVAGLSTPGSATYQAQSFSNPQAFEQAYVSTIQSNFPGAENAGADLSAFVAGLTSGTKGAYFGTGITQQGYLSGVASDLAALGVPASVPPVVQVGNSATSGGTAGVGASGTTGTTASSNAAASGCSTLTGAFTWSCWQNIITDLAFVGIGVLIFIVAVASGLFGGGMPSLQRGIRRVTG